MQTRPIHLQIEEDHHFPNGAQILLNWDLIKELGISIGRKMVLSFGNRRAPIHIGTHAASKYIILIQRTLANHLLIPCNVNLQIGFDHNELKIGPLLGILVSKANFSTPEFIESFGSFCKEIYEAAQNAYSFCYVTSIENMMLEEGTTNGWIFEKEEWKERTLPLPHVFYNRLGNRMLEKSGSDYETLQKVKALGVSIFNEHFLDKWDVYQQLSNTSISYLLPQTYKYQSHKHLQDMLRFYSSIFIKPVHGSEGRGIIRIQKAGRSFTLDHITLNGLEKHLFLTFNDLIKYLSTKIRRKAYLIQRGIHFIEWNDATVDFRALLQKDRNGSWKIISLMGRLGNPQSFVSNLAQGGRLESAVKLLKQLQTKYPNIPTLKELKATALDIATTLDHQLQGNFGEFGIDLGVTANGRIWLIEVNSKPSKRNDAILDNIKGPRPSVQHLFEYVAYLSDFHMIDPSTSTKEAPQKRKNRR